MMDDAQKLLDVLSDLEYSLVEIDRTLDLEDLFYERMDRDIQWLSQQNEWAAHYLEKRFGPLKSLLDTIKIQLSMTHSAMEKAVDKGYEVTWRIKAAATSE